MEAVNLGLSVKWADRNLDANYPSDTGGLYAWAEITPKDKYTWENYVDWLYSGKYGPYKENHFRRRIYEIKSCDDAITYKYGKHWRIPTNNEFEELISKCRWEKAQESNVLGYRIYGVNGNSIFLPICKNPIGFLNYWSATRMVSSPQHAINLDAYNREPRMVYRARFYGFCLRGVYDNK